MKIAVPVICHNGHEAVAIHQFDPKINEFIYKGVPDDQNCICRDKWHPAKGWTVNGEPYVFEETEGGE